jgi:hypothetical protein
LPLTNRVPAPELDVAAVMVVVLLLPGATSKVAPEATVKAPRVPPSLPRSSVPAETVTGPTKAMGTLTVAVSPEAFMVSEPLLVIVKVPAEPWSFLKESLLSSSAKHDFAVPAPHST